MRGLYGGTVGAVGGVLMRRLRGEMLALEGVSEDRCRITWTRVAVASDDSADGCPSGCIWNARGQLLPAAPACYQTCAWDTYARVSKMCCISGPPPK